jgi:hypothetical protein
MDYHIFNITQIERNNLEPLYLEFYGGDVTLLESDVLLISAFKSSFTPNEGTVFQTLKNRYGIEYDDKLPNGYIKISHGLYEFPINNIITPFKRLWVIEIIDFFSSENELIQLKKSFITLSNISSIFDEQNIKSISLPLIGTGDQNLSMTESALEIIKIVKIWSQKSNSLSSVKVSAYDVKAASILNRVIDSHFNSYSEFTDNSISRLFKASTEELSNHLTLFKGEIHYALKELYNMANNSQPSIKSIAIQGRILAEICSRMLFKELFPENEVEKLTLNNLIQKIQNYLLNNAAWILSYLRLLQSCGNSAAHSLEDKLTVADACAVIISSIRLTEFIKNKFLNKK